jgi:hypothetical protein
MAVKVYHADKTLQLLDVLGGGARFDYGGVSGRWGLILSPKSCDQGGDCKNAFFKVDGETIGSQSIENSFQMKKVCLPVRRTYMRVVHVCKHPF